MNVQRFQGIIQEILNPAGIVVNGPHAWDIHINDERFYGRVLRDGSIGLGESYMDGWWDCDRLDEFFFRIMPLRPQEAVRKNLKFRLDLLRAFLLNRACRSRAFAVGERHYDLGNRLFTLMLDKYLMYSCGYWRNSDNLDAAQEAKMELICRKLGLQPGDRILDIGCGWGGFAKYAVERFGVHVVGITVSQRQVEFARKFCAGLPVEIRYQDYRDVDGTFDHIVSIGMFEHVCHKNYRTYMEVVRRCLRHHGLFLLHTIGNNESVCSVDPWFEKYIFPNSMIPSMKQISEASEELFVIEDWHNIGPDYDPTLMSWFHNFDSNWKKLRDFFDERFYRMWKYYLLSCAGTFRARCLQVWQIVFSKQGIRGGYTPVR